MAAGFSAAIAEPTAKAEEVKGLLPRAIKRIITPGTWLDDDARWLCALHRTGNAWGLALLQLASGALRVLPGEGDEALRGTLERLSPQELILAEGVPDIADLEAARTRLPAWRFEVARARQQVLAFFGWQHLEGVGLDAHPVALGALAALLDHVENQDGWFGEGDDMIFIDGDALPTINGTGTEDYYNGAWDFGGKPFAYKHNGAPLISDPEERIGGRYCLYRWHIESPITFEKSIKVTIEHGHANHRSDNFYSTAYWYQTEPHAAFPALPSAAERIPRVFREGGPGALRFREASPLPASDSCLQTRIGGTESANSDGSSQIRQNMRPLF